MSRVSATAEVFKGEMCGIRVKIGRFECLLSCGDDEGVMTQPDTYPRPWTTVSDFPPPRARASSRT